MNSIQLKRSGNLAFENATRLLSALENVVESELTKSPRVKSERKSPFLIVPIATKSRSLDAVFTSKLEDEGRNYNNPNNKSFGSFSPLMLSPNCLKKSQGTPKTLGRVVWDTKDNKWTESKRSPALIRRFESSPSLIFKKKVGDMTYDPTTRTWIGNDDVLADFGDDDDAFGSVGFPRADVSEFKVGNEFNITPEMKKQFEKSANSHTASSFGWWSSDVRMDLFAIRKMAISRIVFDVKNRKDAYETKDVDSCRNSLEIPVPSSPSLSSLSIPNSRNSSRSSSPSSAYSNESSQPGSSRSSSPSSSPSEESWENDVGPWKGTIKLRLPKESHIMSLDFSDDEPAEKKDIVQINSSASEKLALFKEEDDYDDVEKDDDEDNWDADFDDVSIKKINNKTASKFNFKTTSTSDKKLYGLPPTLFI